MVKRIIWLVLIFVSANLPAQYRLSGTVKDAKTGQELPGVTVYVIQTKQGTVTDLDGRFVLKNIPGKAVDVRFSYVGYAPEKRHIVFDKKEKVLEVLLKEEALQLDEVVVSTGFGKMQKDNVVKVAKLPLADLTLKGITNVSRGLASLPGLALLSTGTGIGKPVIHGLSRNRVVIYRQGLRLENYQFGDEHGIGVDASGIAGVEVIKGPASLMYGSGAMGGVVYFVPEKFAPANKFRADFTGRFMSNTGGKFATAGLKKSFEHTKFLFRTTYKHLPDFRLPDGRFAAGSENKRLGYKLGFGYDKTRFSLDLRYQFNHGQNGLPHAVSPVRKGMYAGLYQDLTNHIASLKTDWHGQTGKFISTIGFTSHFRKLMHADTAKIAMRLNTWTYDARYYPSLKQNFDLIIGWQALAQTNLNAGQIILLPDAKIFDNGLFVTARKNYGNTVLQAGLRWDGRSIRTQSVGQAGDSLYRPALNKFLSGFSGSAGVKWQYEKLVLRGNVASGFRAPGLAELTAKGLHDMRYQIGNKDLKNEKNIQTDVDLSYKTSHAEFFAEAYVNRIWHYIYLSPTGQQTAGFPVYRYEQSQALLYGGEAGLHIHPHPWDWLHIRTVFQTVTGKRSGGTYLPLIPADAWKNTVGLRFHGKGFRPAKYFFNLGWNYTFPATHISPFEDPRPGYALVNLWGGAEFYGGKTKFLLSLSVRNLTNRTYIPHLSVLREDGIPEPGRNVIFSVKIDF